MKKYADEVYIETEGKVFWGQQGAGVLIIAQDTGKILLLKRSQSVQEPGTWGTPGGALKDGQNPKQGAIQELKEETQYRGKLSLSLLFVYKSGSFRFYNFLGSVPTKFKPVLDWENSDYGWFCLSELPSPLHFGVKAMLPSLKRKVKLAKWIGQKYPYDIGRATQKMVDDVPLVISESLFQRTMERCAKEMGGRYRDGVMKLPSSPWKIYCHYLKWAEEDGPYVGWMVYPEHLKNKSRMFRHFKCPVENSKETWRRFLQWMTKIIEAVKLNDSRQREQKKIHWR